MKVIVTKQTLQENFPNLQFPDADEFILEAEKAIPISSYQVFERQAQRDAHK